MNEERQLLVGIDLGRTISQISCFDSKLYEPVPIGRMHGTEREYEIPVAFAINRKNNEWLWGTDALEADEDFIHRIGCDGEVWDLIPTKEPIKIEI